MPRIPILTILNQKGFEAREFRIRRGLVFLKRVIGFLAKGWAERLIGDDVMKMRGGFGNISMKNACLGLGNPDSFDEEEDEEELILVNNN